MIQEPLFARAGGGLPLLVRSRRQAACAPTCSFHPPMHAPPKAATPLLAARSGVTPAPLPPLACLLQLTRRRRRAPSRPAWGMGRGCWRGLRPQTTSYIRRSRYSRSQLSGLPGGETQSGHSAPRSASCRRRRRCRWAPRRPAAAPPAAGQRGLQTRRQALRRPRPSPRSRCRLTLQLQRHGLGVAPAVRQGPARQRRQQGRRAQRPAAAPHGRPSRSSGRRWPRSA